MAANRERNRSENEQEWASRGAEGKSRSELWETICEQHDAENRDLSDSELSDRIAHGHIHGEATTHLEREEARRDQERADEAAKIEWPSSF